MTVTIFNKTHVFKNAEEREIEKFLETSRVEMNRVNKYLTKISESQERARKTQTEINRLKKRTNAVLAKLP
jgi:hypothetical protein